MFKKILLLLVMVITFEFLITFIRIYTADVAYELGDRYLVSGDYAKALQYSNQSVALNPHEPNYYRGRARVLVSSLSGVSETKSLEMKTSAVTDLQTAYNLNPNNLVTIRNSIPIYAYIASKDITSSMGKNNVDPIFIDVTREFFAKTNNYSPNDVGVYASFAKYTKRLGLEDEYKYNVEKIRELRPDLLDWFVE